MSNRRGSRRNERRKTTVITNDLIRDHLLGIRVPVAVYYDELLEELLVQQAVYMQ